MHVEHLTSVDGEIVFDFDPGLVGPVAAGVRLAEAVTVDVGAHIARRRSEMYAAFEIRTAGASIGVRPRLLQSRSDTVEALVAELADRFAEGGLDVLADFGVAQRDLVTAGESLSPHLQSPRDRSGPTSGTHSGHLWGQNGIWEGRAAAAGVGAAAQAWLGSLDGVTVAVEGFGAVGEATARDLRARGAALLAVSTERGAIADAAGLDVDELVAAREEHGPGFVHHVGRDVHLPREMHELPVQLLVPGPGIGGIGAAVAGRVQAEVIVPSGFGAITGDGLDVLRGAGTTVLPDVFTASGDALAASSPVALSADEIVARVVRLVSERVEAAKLSKLHPIDYASTLADTFAATWLPHRG